MPPRTARPLRVVILGHDAVLAARPATAVQLAQACLRDGFNFVAPVTWGEELLAARVAEAARVAANSVVVPTHCPFVAESLRATETTSVTLLGSAAPPVATARYLRAAYGERALHITYAGSCPGASAPDVDAVVLPDLLLSRLIEHGYAPELQADQYDTQLPPERARFASMSGGMPERSWLWLSTGLESREVAAATVAAVAAQLGGQGAVLDLHAASGCACARDRALVARMEPPRATAPVVSAGIVVDLASGREEVAKDPEVRLPSPRPPESRAAFVASALTDAEAFPDLSPLRAANLTTPPGLTLAIPVAGQSEGGSRQSPTNTASGASAWHSRVSPVHAVPVGLPEPLRQAQGELEQQEAIAARTRRRRRVAVAIAFSSLSLAAWLVLRRDFSPTPASARAPVQAPASRVSQDGGGR